jgi:hypothetical protein
MGRHSERPDQGPTADDDGNLVELVFDGEILDIIVTRPAPPAGADSRWDDLDQDDDDDWDDDGDDDGD